MPRHEFAEGIGVSIAPPPFEEQKIRGYNYRSAVKAPTLLAHERLLRRLGSRRENCVISLDVASTGSLPHARQIQKNSTRSTRLSPEC